MKKVFVGMIFAVLTPCLFAQGTVNVAAIERAQNVVRTFQQTPYSDDALKLIRDCYEQLGVKDLESDVNRVIELNQNRER